MTRQSRLEEHRIAALLGEAAEPQDPVVPPGMPFTRKARRRLLLQRMRTSLATMAMVVMVGGGGFSIAWYGMNNQLPTNGGDSSVRVSGLEGNDPVVRSDAPGPNTEMAPNPNLPPVTLEPHGVMIWQVPTLPGSDLLTRAQEFMFTTEYEGGSLQSALAEAQAACLANSLRCESPRSDMALPFVDGQVTDLTMTEYLYGLEWLWAQPRFPVGLGFAVPETVEVTVVPADEWPSTMVECLQEAGHPAQVQQGMPWVNSSARTAELAPDARVCAAQYQPPWAWAELDRDQWETVHRHLSETWQPCVSRAYGGDIGPLISRRDLMAAVAAGHPLQVPLADDLQTRAVHSSCEPIPLPVRNAVLSAGD